MTRNRHVANSNLGQVQPSDDGDVMALRQTVQRIDDNLAAIGERLRAESLTPVQIIELQDQIDALLDRRQRVAPVHRTKPAAHADDRAARSPTDT